MKLKHCVCCGRVYDQDAERQDMNAGLIYYCIECALSRCDAYPGECPNAKVRI